MGSNSSTWARLDSSPTSKQRHKHQHFSICVPQLSFSAASASLHSSLRQVHKAAAASSRPSSRPSRARQPFCPAPSPPLRSFPPLSCRPPLVRRPHLRRHRPKPLLRFRRSRPLHRRCPPPFVPSSSTSESSLSSLSS